MRSPQVSNLMHLMKIPGTSLLCFFFLPGLSFAQTHLNGNMLTLSNGPSISIGSTVRIQRPAKGSRFSFIYSELSLRASSEDDLPYGISSSTSNEDVTVKRFLERKGSRGSKFYVICRGSFINNAIDIENALRSGEVTYNGYSAVAGNQGTAAQRPVSSVAPQVNGTGMVKMPVNGTGISGSGATHVMRRPWDNTPVSIGKTDSTAGRVDSFRYTRAFKAVDSTAVNAASRYAAYRRDSLLKAEKIARELSDSRLIEKKAEPVAVPVKPPVKEAVSEAVVAASATDAIKASEPASVKASEAAAVKAAEPVAVKVETDAGNAHSVSGMMTLPTAESLKPKEVISAPAAAKSDAPAGYTKFAKLKQLKELLDAGVLTKAEFDVEKKKVLASE